MLPIEFRVAGFEANETAVESVRSLFAPAMEHLGLTEKDVVSVIFADAENYGPAIHEIAPNDGYTNDGTYLGVGKTIPHFQNGYKGNTLIFNVVILGAFIIGQEPDSGERQAMQYILFHELGHCLDNRRRPEKLECDLPVNGLSGIERCFESNCSEILSEYAACIFSAPYLTPKAFRHIADSTTDNLREYFFEMQKQRELYRIRNVDLNELRDAAMIFFWRGLIEFAKLFAYINGNASLAPDANVNLSWPGKSQTAACLLKSYSAQLFEAWKRYPDCAKEFFSTTKDAWYAITQAEGYRFEVRDDGDCLWLTEPQA